MPLHLKSIQTDPVGVIAQYEITHSIPGRDNTTLTEPLTLKIGRDKAWCEVQIEDCTGATPDEALDRMASWLRRLAEGIEKRAGTVELPF